MNILSYVYFLIFMHLTSSSPYVQITVYSLNDHHDIDDAMLTAMLVASRPINSSCQKQFEVGIALGKRRWSGQRKLLYYCP